MPDVLPNSTETGPAGVSLPTGADQALTFEVVPRHLKMHNISEYELDALSEGGGTLNWTFFGISFGSLISFGVVLYVGNVTDPTKHAMLAMLTFGSLIMSGYFGIRGAIESSNWQKKRDQIKTDVIKKPS
jgi:hypothetical protein